MDRIRETLAELERAAAQDDAIVVAFSGGKDALTTLDLCTRTFARVSAFYMYLVPELAIVEEMLEAARQRWPGLEIAQYPHWMLNKFLTGEVYCAPFGMSQATRKNATMPEWTLRDVYAAAIADAGCKQVATGAKRSDSIWRRRQMANTHWAEVLYPIAGWNKMDVLGYLKVRGIPIPDGSGRAATGIDLSTPSLLWLHDEHPQDFRKLCEAFPYAEAVVARRRFFSIGATVGLDNFGPRVSEAASVAKV